MQDPRREVSQVVSLITAAPNADAQRAAVLRYYSPDAGFRHPFCAVAPGPRSRERILGILQWYRVMSPRLKINVKQFTYDEDKLELFVDVVQEFHIRWSPFPPRPARLLVHLTLRHSVDDPTLLVIARHEDFYHPEDLAALVLPPLVPLIRLALWLGAVISIINAYLFAIFGFWAVSTKKSGNKGKHRELASNSEASSNEDASNGRKID